MRNLQAFCTLVSLSSVLSACGGRRCEELSASECAEDDECSVIRGRPIDQEAECLDGARAVGCMPRGTACGDLITAAVHSRASPYLFTSTCTPDGWTEVEVESAGSWPQCEE